MSADETSLPHPASSRPTGTSPAKDYLQKERLWDSLRESRRLRRLLLPRLSEEEHHNLDMEEFRSAQGLMTHQESAVGASDIPGPRPHA